MEFDTKPALLNTSLNSLFKTGIEMRSFCEFSKPMVEYIYHVDDSTTVEVYNNKTIKKTTFIYDDEDKNEEDYECCDTFIEEIFKPGSSGYNDIKNKLDKLVPYIKLDS